MEKYIPVVKEKTVAWCLLILLCFVFLGCAASIRFVSEDKRIQLVASGLDSGSFKNGPLSIKYSYSRTGDIISLSGNAEFVGRLDYLDIYLLFLDGGGKSVSTKYVYSSGFRSQDTVDKSYQFSKSSLEVPPGAVSISFDYFSEDRAGNRE